MQEKNKQKFIYHSIWTIVDCHWTCINHELINDNQLIPMFPIPMSLSQYLWSYGFVVSILTIDYCLASVGEHKLKFRKHGNKIDIYISSWI